MHLIFSCSDTNSIQMAYSYGMVSGTTVIIEDPKFQPETEDRKKTFPITDSLNATIQCLRTYTGRWFWLRGLATFLVYDGAKEEVLTAVFLICCASSIAYEVYSIIFAALLAKWEALRVHTIVTKPSPNYFYQRLPGWKCWIRILPIMLLDIFARCLTVNDNSTSASAFDYGGDHGYQSGPL